MPSSSSLLPSDNGLLDMTLQECLLVAEASFDFMSEITLTFWLYAMLTVVVMGVVYYYLVLPLNIVKNLSEVGFNHLTDGNNKSALYRNKNKKELAQHVQKLRKLGNLPPIYPNGWFVLLESEDVRRGEVKEVTALGEHFAVFRTQEGKVNVLDAYCPHLGANMAVGGVVHGDCLQCPFHGWSFSGTTGKCTTIPYADKIPEMAKVKKWTSCELNSFIYVWYHAEGEPPNWFIADRREINGKLWSCHGRTEFMINSHIQDIPENGGDVAHLNAIHKPAVFAGSDLRFYEKFQWQFLDHLWSASWEQSTEHKHIGVMQLSHKNRIFNKFEFMEINVTSHQIGPGYVELNMASSMGPILLLQAVTPVEPMVQRVIHRIYSPFYNALFSKFALYAESVMFERDIMVWNNKKYVDKPIVLKEEKALAKHRRWYSQFYSENSPKFNYSKDTLDW